MDRLRANQVNEHRSDPQPVAAEKKPFWFFPSRDRDPVFEGRDPHEPVKTDWMGNQFPRPWHIATLLFGVALAVYLVSMSRTAFPGLPTQSLLQHLKLEISPAALDLFWGWGVRGADRLPGLSVAAWMGLFSAVCGALSVALLGWLMTRVGYVIRNEPGQASFIREAQARRLSGLVSGLYLLFTIPFWVVSTRSLPGSFHVLWLLLTACVFSQYQLWGRRTYLFYLGFLYGAGMTESATFLVFLPLAVFLVAREMFRWHALFDWRRQIVLWSGLLLGLSLYLFHAVILYEHGLPADLYASPGQALIDIWKKQFHLILQVRYSTGFFVVMFFCLGPWLTLFVMSRRSPWFYEWGQIAVRLIFIAGLMAVLYNASFGPWNLMGMQFLLVTPYVLMAVAVGYMAGEFWILGERHHLLDYAWTRRLVRRVTGLFALVILPLALVAGGVRNWTEASGRYGAPIHRAAEDVLDRLDKPKVLFAAGVLDDALRVVIRERWSPVVMVSLPRVSSPVYLQRLAGQFANESLVRPLQAGDFESFFDNLLMSEAGLNHTVTVDVPDLFRKYGHMRPDGFLYHLQMDALTETELLACLEAQRPFWAHMEQLASDLPPEENPAYLYQRHLCLMASRVANNFGVVLAEHGHPDAAAEAFEAAGRLYPDNLSVLLNRLAIRLSAGREDSDGIEAEIEKRLLELKGEQWALAALFGHVWRPRQWLGRGWVWALAGTPSAQPGARYIPPKPEEEEASEQERLFDKAYLQWGKSWQEEGYYRSLLVRDPRNTEALVSLARLALRQRDFEVADACLQQAVAMGHHEESLLFDRAMESFMRGDAEEAVERIEDLSHFTPGDVRVWLALVLMTDAGDPRNEQAIRTLRKHPGENADMHKVLGSVYMARSQWNLAMSHLETAVGLDVRNAHAWEMLLTVAQEQQNPRLIQAAQRALMGTDSSRYLQFQQAGLAHYAKGELAEAEQAFREGLRQQRHPTLLNNLAHVLMEQGEKLPEALMLVSEAVRRQPGTPSILNTRAQILMAMDRLPEARRDVAEALRRRGRNMAPLLDLALRYWEQGDAAQTRTLVAVADRLRDRLDAVQRERLDVLKAQLAEDDGAQGGPSGRTRD